MYIKVIYLKYLKFNDKPKFIVKLQVVDKIWVISVKNYFGKCTFAYLHVSFASETETNLDFYLSVCLALSLGVVFSALFTGKQVWFRWNLCSLHAWVGYRLLRDVIRIFEMTWRTLYKLLRCGFGRNSSPVCRYGWTNNLTAGGCYVSF